MAYVGEDQGTVHGPQNARCQEELQGGVGQSFYFASEVEEGSGTGKSFGLSADHYASAKDTTPPDFTHCYFCPIMPSEG